MSNRLKLILAAPAATWTTDCPCINIMLSFHTGNKGRQVAKHRAPSAQYPNTAQSLLSTSVGMQ